MEIDEMKKSDLLLEIQKFGKNVNPGKKREELIAILKELQKGSGVGGGLGSGALMPNQSSDKLKNNEEEKELTDTDRILQAIGGLANKVETMDKRLKKVETGDANAFQEHAKEEDVEHASALNSKIDKRITSIIEKTLGVDFAVEMEGYDDKPGMLLTILVPQRLSPIPTSFRPIKDKVTGEYIVNEKTKHLEEEEYWPGDRRSVAMGANDSFDVIQKHANRVRSFIMSTYQKQNKPQPDFRVRQ